ncbi:MAG TPA: hypothetical protein VFK14_12455 [Solirubrobacterales bacterium]|nr:hypothetical protein [Solirubrobacterales bacterium]
MPGVIQQEREREQKWADRGLPDPVRVLGSERASRHYGSGFRSPLRALLDPYLAAHPDERPRGW